MEGTITISLKDFLNMKNNIDSNNIIKEQCKSLLQEAHREYSNYFSSKGFDINIINDLSNINKNIMNKYKIEL